ncbi:MAG: transcriptional repressor LexA [Candidatus Brocadiaceae bacterium]|nr:transcriptional repressor LexA [Candidatus Brocadiaceae bacterium]
MITKKQKDVLDFISKYAEKNGYAPSLEEMRIAFKFASVSTPYHYVKKLQEEGYIKKEDNRPRAISVYPGGEIKSPFLNRVGLDSIKVPVVGSANCGPATILANENIEGYLKVSRDQLKDRDGVFALRVSGNSLNKANIHGKNVENGDFVLIDSKNRTPHNGEYVLSIIDGAANLKRYIDDKKNNQITLMSESSEDFKPIFIQDGDDFAINGKILAVIKKPKIG